MDTRQLIDIVEDDEAMSRALASLVESLGYLSRSHSTAREYLAAHVPDEAACVILDVRLPGMSGLDLQKELTDTGSPPPIIFITGHGDARTAEQAMARGAAAFLEKPFPAVDFARAIRAAIHPGEEK